MITADKKSLSIIRNYALEVFIIVLSGAVVTLFNLYLNLNSYVRETMIEQSQKITTVVIENTEALKQFNQNQNKQK